MINKTIQTKLIKIILPPAIWMILAVSLNAAMPDPNNPYYNSDINPPLVTIVEYPAQALSLPTVTLKGTVADDVEIIGVEWVNSRGGSGICSGLSNWTASNIALYEGDNLINIVAMDEAGNVGVHSVFIKYENPIHVSLFIPVKAKPNEEVVVTVNYSNPSSSDISNVNIKALVPTGMNYVLGSAESSNGTYNSSLRTVQWPLLLVASGEIGTRTFKVSVK